MVNLAWKCSVSMTNAGLILREGIGLPSIQDLYLRSSKRTLTLNLPGTNFGKACTIRVTSARRATPLFRTWCESIAGGAQLTGTPTRS